MEILKFGGVYKDYLWGGNKMRESFGVVTDISPVAESWVLSCHNDGMSVICGGEYDGVSLKDYIEKNKAVLGTKCKTGELPVLIKFIDAAQNLSVQVHPDDEKAKLWENQNGKTEMWYVVEADEGAKITYGMKRDTTKEEFSSSIQNQTVENLLNSVDSKKGDVFFVEAGTVHAIGAGNLIAEIQQNSNVTYRLYDYGRVGKDGKTRELHIDKGVACSDTKKVSGREICECSDGTKMIGSCEYFQVKEIALSDEKRILCADEKSYHSLVATEGTTRICYSGKETELKKGSAVFIPAGLGEYDISGSGTVLLVRNAPEYYAKVSQKSDVVSVYIEDEYGDLYGKGEAKASEDAIDKAIALAAKNSGIKTEDIKEVR